MSTPWPVVALLACLFGCGARPTPPPAPQPPDGLLFQLQVGDLGGSLARLAQVAERVGAQIDLRGPLRDRLRALTQSARLDGPWWLLGFEVDGEPGLALVMHGAAGADEPTWRAHPLGRWETAIRRVDAHRLVATDRPGWIDAHRPWVSALQAHPGPDLQLELPLASSLAERAPAGLDDPDLAPGQQDLLRAIWRIAKQIDRLGLSLDLRAERLVLAVRIHPAAQSDLARALTRLEPLPAAAWGDTPRHVGAVGCRLPTEAWRGLEALMQAADPGPPDETDRLRADALTALSGDAVISFGVEAPPVLLALQPADRAAVDRVLGVLAPRRLFSVDGIAVESIGDPQREDGLLARRGDGLLLAFGTDSREGLRRLLANETETGPRADADLADAISAHPDAFCLATVDAGAARLLGGRASAGPPVRAAADAKGGVLTLRVDLPFAQIRPLLRLWMTRDRPDPAPRRRDI